MNDETDYSTETSDLILQLKTERVELSMPDPSKPKEVKIFSLSENLTLMPVTLVVAITIFLLTLIMTVFLCWRMKSKVHNLRANEIVNKTNASSNSSEESE